MSQKITRRDFIKIGAAGTLTAVLAGCTSPYRSVALEPYVVPPEEQIAGQATWYASTCRQCPAGCGIIVRIMNGRALKIEGNPEHPLNRGKLCPRGHAPLQVLYHPDRLDRPVQQAQRGSRQFTPVLWDNAVKTLTDNLNGAGRNVAVWLGTNTSGHLLDLFRKFAAAIGAPAPLVYDFQAEWLGYQPLLAASQGIFGRAALPTFDLSHADVVFSFNADFVGAWMSQTRYNIEFGGFRSQPFGKRGVLVQFEPRMSLAGVKADRWVGIRPGSEGLVAQAIARIIADRNLGGDKAGRARAVAGGVDLNAVAALSDVPVDQLGKLAELFAAAERPIAIPGPTVTGGDNANEAVAAVQALNAIAGRFGQTGGAALSPESPNTAVTAVTPSSYSDFTAFVDRLRSGNVQALLVHGADPLYDFAGKFGIQEAIQEVPFVASFASLVDDTAAWANMVLPDRTPLESWGYTVVSPSFGPPVVSSQQPVVVPVRDARATGDVLLAVAKNISAAASALPWSDEVAYLKETVTKLSAGAAGGSGTDELWARFQQHGGWWPASPAGGAASPVPSPKAVTVSAPKYQGGEQDYPFYLHLYAPTIQGVGNAAGVSTPWLLGSPDPMSSIMWQTWVEIHPKTAAKLGLAEGDIVKVTSPQGEIQAPVYTYPGIRLDTVAIPLGLGHTDLGRYAKDKGANALRLLGPQANSAGSGLAWSNVRVKLTRTGQTKTLAKFENTVGTRSGFLNQDMPGR